jgi:hypothetical protein
VKVLVVLAILSGCTQPENNTLSLALSADMLEQSDGVIVYQGYGSFLVTVTAKTEPTTDTNLATLAAELVISTDGGTSGPATKATLVRSASDARMFAGTAMLSWPLGGDILVTAKVAGVEKSEPFTIAKPEIALVFGAPSPNTGTASVDVPFCIVSSVRGASVVVHLEAATFAGTADVDKTAPLLREGCTLTGVTPPPGLVVQSHATLGLTTLAAMPTVSVTLTSPVMSAAPLAYIAPMSPMGVVVPPKVKTVRFTTPIAPASAQVGHVVPVSVLAVDANDLPVQGVSVSFSSSAEVVFVPATTKTNGSGAATTSFVMPDLDGGSLLISATGAAPLEIATAP